MRPSVILTTLAVLAASCSHSGPAPAVPSSPTLESLGKPVQFSYPSVSEAGDITASNFRGRPSVLVFITSFDLASQAQARFLSIVAKRHDPPIFAAAIALEPPENRPLLASFASMLGLEYPLGIGDRALIEGESPFGDVSVVPTTVVLDQEGKIVAKRVGLVKDDELEGILARLQAG